MRRHDNPILLFNLRFHGDSARLMKKVLPLQLPGRVDARVVEAVKNEVRKYVQRERRKTPPEGFSGWQFACRIGSSAESATVCVVPELSQRIDDVVRAGEKQVYVEILAQPVKRGGDVAET